MCAIGAVALAMCRSSLGHYNFILFFRVFLDDDRARILDRSILVFARASHHMTYKAKFVQAARSIS